MCMYFVYSVPFLLLTTPAISVVTAEATQTLVIESMNAHTVNTLYFGSEGWQEEILPRARFLPS